MNFIGNLQQKGINLSKNLIREYDLYWAQMLGVKKIMILRLPFEAIF